MSFSNKICFVESHVFSKVEGAVHIHIEAFEEQEKHETPSSVLKTNAIEYCLSTSVHGFAYLPSARDWCERLFWAMVIIAGLTLASIIINEAFT